MRPARISLRLVFLLAVCAAMPSLADTVQIPASRDNTLYEDPAGDLSNGAGPGFFAGTTATEELRRALVAFDVAGAVPAGETITSVTLTLYMSRTIFGPVEVSLHRATSDWGEGTSVAPGEGGGGAAATPGDATWIHAFYPTDLWGTAGGDFAPAASGTATVDQDGFYTWASTPALVADVQGWLDDPSQAFGWVVVGGEADVATAKRFESRESADPSQAPVLTVTYGGSDAVPAASRLSLALVALILLGASLLLRRA